MSVGVYARDDALLRGSPPPARGGWAGRPQLAPLRPCLRRSVSLCISGRSIAVSLSLSLSLSLARSLAASCSRSILTRLLYALTVVQHLPVDIGEIHL